MAASRPLQLVPAAVEQERVATIQEIDAIIVGSSNPAFIEQAKSFRAAYRPGFRLYEYCSSVSDWHECMGSAGFILRRGTGKEVIASLVLRMN